jgi:hypothetical protein
LIGKQEKIVSRRHNLVFVDSSLLPLVILPSKKIFSKIGLIPEQKNRNSWWLADLRGSLQRIVVKNEFFQFQES